MKKTSTPTGKITNANGTFYGYAVFEWWNAERTSNGSCCVEQATSYDAETWRIYTEKSGALRRANMLNENCGKDGPRWGVVKVVIKALP